VAWIFPTVIEPQPASSFRFDKSFQLESEEAYNPWVRAIGVGLWARLCMPRIGRCLRRCRSMILQNWRSKVRNQTPAPSQASSDAWHTKPCHNPTPIARTRDCSLFTFQLKGFVGSETRTPGCGFDHGLGIIQGHSILLLTGVDDAIDNLLLCRTQLALGRLRRAFRVARLLPGCWASSLSVSRLELAPRDELGEARRSKNISASHCSISSKV